MKAVVLEGYGPPERLRLQEVPRPTPGDGELRVRMEAAAVAAGDWHLMRGDPFLVRLMFGLRRPRFAVLGSDVAGIVEEVGPGVTRFQPGDAVVGHLSEHGFGAFAEEACAPESAWAPKPEALTFAEAAAVPGSALAALQGLRDHGKVQAGERVLVNGASGGVGHMAVQIAKALGADVTGVCSSRNVDMVRSLGADRVIDYTREDFTRTGDSWDLILDAAAFRPTREHLPALVPGGRYVLVGGDFRRTLEVMLLGPLQSALAGKKLFFYVTKPTQADLAYLMELAGRGALRAVIDRRYPLAQVPEAVAYQETGRARGKVVIEG